jgi:hypothetical protein
VPQKPQAVFFDDAGAQQLLPQAHQKSPERFALDEIRGTDTHPKAVSFFASPIHVKFFDLFNHFLAQYP